MENIKITNRFRLKSTLETSLKLNANQSITCIQLDSTSLHTLYFAHLIWSQITYDLIKFNGHANGYIFVWDQKGLQHQKLVEYVFKTTFPCM